MATNTITTRKNLPFFSEIAKKLLIFFSVFGPATITAMADNDASGVATYSIAGAKLGYPILFLLAIITILLAITQEMGMRMTIITGKGLADLIREKYGARISVLIFAGLMLANIGTIVVDLAAVKTTSSLLHLPSLPMLIIVVAITGWFVLKGNYRQTQNIMLFSCLFFLAYIVSAIAARPDWGLATSNLVVPHGVAATPGYLKDYVIIGMGVLGTTITPWGQFFISSFAYDKKIEKGKVSFSQMETYWGAFLTNAFSFFMIVATAATLFMHHIPLESGEQAALAIQPFAGNMAGTLFAIGILNAGFMGVVTVSLSTAYAFSEFFGLPGSLNNSFKESRTFYILFLAQVLVAALAVMLPGISLFQIVMGTQVFNALLLPVIFYYLITLTSSKELMGKFINSPFQKYFSIACTVVIVLASLFTVAAVLLKL